MRATRRLRCSRVLAWRSRTGWRSPSRPAPTVRSRERRHRRAPPGNRQHHGSQPYQAAADAHRRCAAALDKRRAHAPRAVDASATLAAWLRRFFRRFIILSGVGAYRRACGAAFTLIEPNDYFLPRPPRLPRFRPLLPRRVFLIGTSSVNEPAFVESNVLVYVVGPFSIGGCGA